MDIEFSLLTIIKQHIKCNDKIDINYKFGKDDVDSISFINIVIDIEKTFNIDFEDDMLLMELFPDVLSFEAYIRKLLYPRDSEPHKKPIGALAYESEG